jgi:hypothetical protein
VEPDTFVSEKAMRQFREFAGKLGLHAWRDLLYSNYGRYNPGGIEPAAFVGWLRPLSTSGLTAVEGFAKLKPL